MQAFAGLFGGKPKDNGAAALAKKQAAELDERRAKEKADKDAQIALLKGLQGNAGSGTTFLETGTAGLSPVLG